MVFRRSFLSSTIGLFSWVSGKSVLAQNFTIKKNWDVIVIGSGLAGLSAAVTAQEYGARNVLLLEKTSIIGGHSRLSTGSFCAYTPKRIFAQGLPDRSEDFVEDILKAGQYHGSKQLVQTLVSHSELAMDWLESLGLSWGSEPFTPVGAYFPRGFSSALGQGGSEYIKVVNKAARRLGVTIAFNTKALDLLKDKTSGAINGVVLKTQQGNLEYLNSKSVIIATGGFVANNVLCKKFNPSINITSPTTANPWGKLNDPATGDGLLMAQRIGADTVDLECIQCIPFLGGRLLDYAGGDIFVNSDGQRFVNEASTLGELSAALEKQKDKSMWAVTDSASKKGASLESKMNLGVIVKCPTIEDLSKEIGCPVNNIKETLDRYNEAYRLQKDLDFGKTVLLQPIKIAPFYVGKERVCRHFCCGGLRFNSNAEVLDKNNNPISGLYVAGEASGGLFGKDRLGGTSLLACVVFGRIAGFEAAKRSIFS